MYSGHERIADGTVYFTGLYSGKTGIFYRIVKGRELYVLQDCTVDKTVHFTGLYSGQNCTIYRTV